MAYDEPRYFTENAPLGRINMTLRGEKYSGSPILDTEVKIGDTVLCWISWPDKEDFIKKLNAVINEYSI